MCKDDLLKSIKLGFKPDRDFFLKVYAYDIGTPGFRDIALNLLNGSGYPMAWRDYAAVVTEYENQRDSVFRRAARSITVNNIQIGGKDDG